MSGVHILLFTLLLIYIYIYIPKMLYYIVFFLYTYTLYIILYAMCCICSPDPLRLYVIHYYNNHVIAHAIH